MSHSPMQIYHLGLAYFKKTCFENFNASIDYGNKIAVVGRNDSGKTALLTLL